MSVIRAGVRNILAVEAEQDEQRRAPGRRPRTPRKLVRHVVRRLRRVPGGPRGRRSLVRDAPRPRSPKTYFVDDSCGDILRHCLLVATCTACPPPMGAFGYTAHHPPTFGDAPWMRRSSSTTFSRATPSTTPTASRAARTSDHSRALRRSRRPPSPPTTPPRCRSAVPALHSGTRHSAVPLRSSRGSLP